MQSDADAAKPLAGIWDDVVLDPRTQAEIFHLVDLIQRDDRAAPRGMLLVGPPGTGKTEIARRLASEFHYAFLGTTTSLLTTLYVGERRNPVKDIWDRARACGPCLIAIDDCEGIFARCGGNTDSILEYLIQTFLSEWDKVPPDNRRVLVIGVTSRRELLDEAIVQRFGAIIEVGLPDEPQRQRLFQLKLGPMRLDCDAPEVAAELAGLTPGATGRDIKTMVDRALLRAVSRSTDPRSMMLTRADLLACVPVHPED